MNPADHLIVALDFPNRAQALDMVERLEGNIRWFKVGLELYLAEGRGVVEAIRERGYDVFLDLKLHDIPNTVASAVRTASASGASLLTLHAVGGPVMLAAAKEAADGPNAEASSTGRYRADQHGRCTASRNRHRNHTR